MEIKVKCLSNYTMGESSKFQESRSFKIQIFNLVVCLQSVNNFKLKWSIALIGTENQPEKLLKSA